MDSYGDKRDCVLKAALECRTELVAYARSLLGNYANQSLKLAGTIGNGNVSKDEPATFRAFKINFRRVECEESKVEERVVGLMNSSRDGEIRNDES